MASDYRVAVGHDIALISLNIVTPQPLGRPLRPTQRTYGLTGQPHDMANYVEWVFDAIANTTEYVALLTQFGLHSADTASVTIYTRTNRLAYQRYNALAMLPEMGREADWSRGFLRNIVIALRNLEAI